MKNKESICLNLTVIFCSLIIAFSWVYLVQGTTIGTNISTVDIITSGNATTTGTTDLATTTINNTLTVTGTTTIGSGTGIGKIMHGTVTINPLAINTSTTGLATSTLANATADMKCFIQSPWNLNDDLVFKGCTTTAGFIGVYLYNPSAVSTNSIDDVTTTWGYLLIK